MTGKSRHKKGKYSFQDKRRKERSNRPTGLDQQPAPVPAHEPASSPPAPVPAVSVPTPKTKPVSYPYVTAELRTISILASIMLIILIVLAFVLS